MGAQRQPWLFNIFFDRIVTVVNERPTGRGVKLRDGKLYQLYKQVTQRWWQKQVRISNIFLVILRKGELIEFVANNVLRDYGLKGVEGTGDSEAL